MGEEQQQSYLDFAQVGRGRWWWYLLGTAFALFLWFLVTSVTEAARIIVEPPQWVGTGLLLAGFLGLFIGVPLAVAVVNGRPWQSVITPFTRINWSLIVRGVLFWGMPMVVISALLIPLDTDGLRLTTDVGDWVLLLLVVLVLVGFQTTAEELLFRGYLMQWASLASRNRWYLSMFSAVLFTLPHLANPEVTSVAGLELVVTVLTYALVGFAFGWVSVSSGTIELAIGAHFINNLLSFAVLSADNSVAGSSLVVDTSPNVYLGAVGVFLTVAAFIYLTRNARGAGEALPVAQAEPAVVAVVPAGWYDDPTDGAQVRWWDGQAWTHHTSAKPSIGG